MSFDPGELSVQGNPNRSSYASGEAHLAVAAHEGNRPLVPEKKDTGAESDGALLDKLLKKMARSRSKVMDWRNMAFQDRRFYDGHQWSGVELRMMRDQQRPDINFNRIRPVVKAISGLERMNRTETRFVSPRLDSTLQEDIGDDLATWAVRELFDRTEADSERSDVAEDALIVGMGWEEISFDPDAGADGEIQINRVPWKEMSWDCASTKRNLEDASWIAREKHLPEDAIRYRWPEKADLVLLSGGEMSDTRPGVWEQVTPWFSAANAQANASLGTTAPERRDGAPVTQIQWKERRRVVAFIDPREGPNGKVQEMAPERFAVLKERLAAMGLPEPQSTHRTRTVWRQAYLARRVLLEVSDLPHGATFLCLTYEWEEESRSWRGLVTHMRDPQKLANKSISQAMHLFNTNAKGGVLFESDAFVDAVKAKGDWSSPNAFIQMSPGGINKIKDRSKEATQIPQALPLFISYAVRGINDVTGVNVEMMGMSEGDVPTSTLRARQMQGFAILGSFFDAIARFRRREALLALEFVRNYGPFGRPVRIGGDFADRMVPLLPQHLPSSAEVVVDETSYRNPNLRAQVWTDLQPMIPALLRFGAGQFLLETLKYSPLPAQLVAQLHQIAKTSPPPGRQSRGKQEPPAITMGKAQKLHADAEKALAQARALDTERHIRALEAGVEAMSTASRDRENAKTQEVRRAKDVAEIAQTAGHGIGHLARG